MAECFCGCGRKVGGLIGSRKSANGVGRKARDTAEQLEALRPTLVQRGAEAGSSTSKITALLDKHLEGCHSAEETCRDVVHEERSFKEVDWPSVRNLVKQGEGMAAFFSLPPEQQRAIASS